MSEFAVGESSRAVDAFAKFRSAISQLATPFVRNCLFIAFAAVVLHLTYETVIRASVPSADFEFKHSFLIVLNLLASLLTLVVVPNTKGNFQHRMETGLVCALISFGTLTMIITVFRLYYSRPLLITAFLASIAALVAFNMLIERSRKKRIGIVPNSLDDETEEELDREVELIPSPDCPSGIYDVVLIDWARVRDPEWLQFATREILSGGEVYHIAAYIEDRKGRVIPDNFGIVEKPSMSPYMNFFKRMFDIVFVFVFAPLAILVVLTAGLLVALTMGRPIFYSQKRVGLNGTPFTMYKLRSMTKGGIGDVASATKVNDARITPLGAFLRRFRIDEIPQFYNILVGEMSLVGPRPEQPDLARDYTKKWPQFGIRTKLRPGITGWAQVRGSYAADETETKSKLSYDLYYVKNASLVMDFEILVRTFKTLVTGNSAR